MRDPRQGRRAGRHDPGHRGGLLPARDRRLRLRLRPAQGVRRAARDRRQHPRGAARAAADPHPPGGRRRWRRARSSGSRPCARAAMGRASPRLLDRLAVEAQEPAVNLMPTTIELVKARATLGRDRRAPARGLRSLRGAARLLTHGRRARARARRSSGRSEAAVTTLRAWPASDERLHGLKRLPVRSRIRGEGPTTDHAGVVEAEREPAAPAHSSPAGRSSQKQPLAFCSPGLRRGGPPSGRSNWWYAPAYSVICASAAGFPQPFHVGAASPNGREVVGRPVEEADRPVGHRLGRPRRRSSTGRRRECGARTSRQRGHASAGTA